MASNIRQFKELDAGGDPFKDARQFIRLVDVIGYVAVGLLLVGAAVLVGRAVWL